ncbi:uncharacterized protein F4812DRAFT_410325 [Daldinia caldariorum]|uniref:uncharacterized protein n=1 Tax=Daldinia caldariorum TaxID=326644 RepID=UPI0020086051|nr:uncharacterized protein F4812DRAFT_410325 [Daldinia caldariorum]KAI1472805.1 hypothetical protein F4812DRAFT_410325 [Daldinia caldariorum]
MDGPGKKLLDELRSLLDETTILSILSDYNLEDPKQFADARQVLLTISKDVEAEEATGFNPSGLGADDIVDINPSSQDEDLDATGATSSDVKSTGGFTATTESSIPLSIISSESSKMSTPGTPVDFHARIFNGLTDDEKEGRLIQMFILLKPIDVKLSLQKAKGDASLAIDELLNLQLLEQTGQRPKGIDGFYVSDDDVPSKKKKGKKKKKAAKVALPKHADPEDTLQDASNGDAAQSEDRVALISDKLQLPHSEVASIYRQHNASLGATVVKILDNYIAAVMPVSNLDLASPVEQKKKQFPWVPPEYVEATCDICSTPGDATDIIRILGDHFEKPAYLKYDISYSVVASHPEEIVMPEPINASNLRQSPRSPTAIRSQTVELPIRASTRPGNLKDATSKTLAESRNHSFSSATAAFKKGRSNPLYRQAGAYYAERGRQQAMSYRQANSVEANYLVDQQSREDMIDLHGVTVQDGVEIALDRVSRWWQGLGEERARKAKTHGLTVVTGIGRHSSDGRSPLRASVIKALVADGWKVEIQTGSCLITGRQ